MMQDAVGPVASSDRWKQMGRYVKKGAKALEIIRPVLVTVKDEETGEKMKRLVGFRPVRAAFDYPDTDGKAVAIP